MSIKTDKKFLLKVCMGEAQAANFLFAFFAACHLWDDLIDKDKDITDDRINRAFWAFIVDIPLNPWYQRNILAIHPVMVNAIQEWMVANKLEKSDRQDIAYTLRCSIVSVVHQAAYICGGYDWAIEIGEEIRRYAQSETYDEYLGELNAGVRSSRAGT
jgi:hypothetical protein